MDEIVDAILADVLDGRTVAVPVGSRGDRRAFISFLERVARHRGVLAQVRDKVKVIRFKGKTYDAAKFAVAATRQEPAKEQVMNVVEMKKDTAPATAAATPPSTPAKKGRPPGGANAAKTEFATALIMEHPDSTNAWVIEAVHTKFGDGIPGGTVSAIRRELLGPAAYLQWLDGARRKSGAKAGAQRSRTMAARRAAREQAANAQHEKAKLPEHRPPQNAAPVAPPPAPSQWRPTAPGGELTMSELVTACRARMEADGIEQLRLVFVGGDFKVRVIRKVEQDLEF